MSHNHSCSCDHVEVKFCKHCSTVYCKGCNQEWTTKSNFNPYWNYTAIRTLGNSYGGFVHTEPTTLTASGGSDGGAAALKDYLAKSVCEKGHAD